jgi:NADPH-dependent curcumin reductase CurA
VYDYQNENIQALDEIYDLVNSGKFIFYEDMKIGGVEMCPKMFENFYKGENYGKYYLKIH